MPSRVWDEQSASHYDESSSAKFDPAVLDTTVECLADLAAGGAAVEFAVGTGRVALPLRRHGVPVHGIELSPHMAVRLREKPGADGVPVTIGDMTTTRVAGDFTLVYLVWNTLMNVTTQDEQVAVFMNAAAHLAPGGRFVIELVVPEPQPTPRVFTLEPNHVGIETFEVEDPVAQIAWSHHWIQVGEGLVHDSAPYRYVWPAELDLMGRLAGFRLEHRWADWDRSPFTGRSTSQVAVYRLEERTS